MACLAVSQWTFDCDHPPTPTVWGNSLSSVHNLVGGVHQGTDVAHPKSPGAKSDPLDSLQGMWILNGVTQWKKKHSEAQLIYGSSLKPFQVIPDMRASGMPWILLLSKLSSRSWELSRNLPSRSILCVSRLELASVICNPRPLVHPWGSQWNWVSFPRMSMVPFFIVLGSLCSTPEFLKSFGVGPRHLHFNGLSKTTSTLPRTAALSANSTPMQVWHRLTLWNEGPLALPASAQVLQGPDLKVWEFRPDQGESMPEETKAITETRSPRQPWGHSCRSHTAHLWCKLES